jgi:hypothetical protein
MLSDMGPVRILTRRRRAASVVTVLALALVFAQLGVIAHFGSHLASAAGHSANPSGASSVCPSCASFSPLLAMVGGATHVLEIVWRQGVPDVRVREQAGEYESPRHAFRSRAPPVVS